MPKCVVAYKPVLHSDYDIEVYLSLYINRGWQVISFSRINSISDVYQAIFLCDSDHVNDTNENDKVESEQGTAGEQP